MRFRAGLVIGFATGFYAGAMAGRERYEQINRTLRRAKRSDAFDAATGKAKAVVNLGVERARDLVETKFGRDSGPVNVSAPTDNDLVAPSPSSTPTLSEPSTPSEARSGEVSEATVPSKAGNGDRPH
jgi:hypothetical protein